MPHRFSQTGNLDLPGPVNGNAATVRQHDKEKLRNSDNSIRSVERVALRVSKPDSRTRCWVELFILSRTTPQPGPLLERGDVLRTTSVIVQDALELLIAVQDSVTGFDNGTVTWAETIPERALTSLKRFPQSDSVTEPEGKKTRVPFQDRLASAWSDEIDAFFDELSTKSPLPDEFKATFIRAKFYLMLLTGLHAGMDGEKPLEQFNAPLWELRQMLVVTALQAENEGGSEEETRETEAEWKASSTSRHGGGSPGSNAEFLKASDPKAEPYRDGTQWCDVRYARILGITAQHIDRARKDDGCYEVRLTDRRKADAPGKPFVYRRAELHELSGAIPDEHKV